MKWAGHVACMGDDRGVHMALMGMHEGKRLLWRPRCKWGIILRWIFRRLEGSGDRIELTQDRTGGGHSCVGWGTFGFHKWGEFHD